MFNLSVFLCKIYCWFNSSFGFQMLFFIAFFFPLFPSLPLHFNYIIHSFVPLPSFFVPFTATSSPSTYFICSFKKSIFDRLTTILHPSRKSLTFHGNSLLKFLSYSMIFQLPNFPSRRYADGFYRFC